ncbi:MAG: beta-N-acetylhexosaminidase [Deltaproteobacteria bacterium]|nr:beta-N-acetylhexosaminidase [Deltaproteobacteria bacterium]
MSRQTSGRARVPALRAAISRLFVAGIPETTLDDGTRALHADAPFGGVVLFRRNAAEPHTMRALAAAIHRLDRRLPPLVAIDHEGGRVHRLSAPFTHFPAAAAVAAHGARAVRAVATAMAHELAAIGVDLTFAPVLDVASNPANPVIGDRAFAADPERVASLALTAFRATRAVGLLTCGKHFPGHGDTTADSHLELPIVDKSRRDLARTELVPFRRAITAGIPMLMTAHVLYAALDPKRPATLSRAILTDLLRRRLGFRGVICSDDLEMRAIADHYGPGEAAVAALAAGADLLLYCHCQDDLRIAIAAVERAVADGRLPERHIAAAHRRVVALARWRTRRRRAVPISVIGARAHARLDASLRT